MPFLTHIGSSSYNHNKNFPNENYACEVMQLFTVNLFHLRTDGTIMQSPSGEALSTYDIDNILAFSRVVTGFTEQNFRTNSEYPRRVGNPVVNIIDPIVMDPMKHDAYPKQDLLGGYIGDGYPLCSDLPVNGFLAKGARFELQSQLIAAPLLLSQGSALYRALCSDAGTCAPKLWTELSEKLACSGDEGEASSVQFLQAGDQVFKFVQPACVHLQFPEVTKRSSKAPVHNGKEFHVALSGYSGRVTQLELECKAAACRQKAVFSAAPTEADALAQLKIGAYAPDMACSSGCAGAVKVYGTGFDTNTIFEVGNKFYRNVEFVVTLANSQEFRNPPTFHKITTVTDNSGRAALDEVEALLGHLFNHFNCPTFIGSRLIQRFGVSTPSKAYVDAVSKAFREGTYGQFSEFSGKRKLAATATAVLLQQEDAGFDSANIGKQGSLREPLLKFLHLMRSMEYRDARDELIVMPCCRT